MSQAILLATFDFDFGENEPFEATLKRAHALAERDGLVWKVWLRDRTTSRGGGIYLFEDRGAAQAWVDEAFQHSQPWTANMHWEILEIDEALSLVTHAKLADADELEGV
jgi:putative monooxygenase ydhR